MQLSFSFANSQIQLLYVLNFSAVYKGMKSKNGRKKIW